MLLHNKTDSIVGKRCATPTEIERIVGIIVDKIDPIKIILFGSYAAGNATPESDVDLLVIVDSNQSNWGLATQISTLIDHRFPVEILVRSAKEIERRLEMGDFFVRSMIEKGKVLYERSRS